MWRGVGVWKGVGVWSGVGCRERSWGVERGVSVERERWGVERRSTKMNLLTNFSNVYLQLQRVWYFSDNSVTLNPWFQMSSVCVCGLLDVTA